MRNLIAILVLVLGLASVQAREVGGVELAESIVLEPGAETLVLNGAGIRKKFFFSIYVASLYLPETSREASAILAADQANRLQMDMLYSEVEKRKLVEAWNEGFEANQTAAQLQPLRERIARFNDLFTTLVAGDQVQLDYLPGQGTRVSINGVEQGRIPGSDFNRALLKIWLGESPVTSGLKQALLGG